MPLNMSYKFSSSINLMEKIDCLKEKLNLTKDELDEGRGYTLRNQDNSIRIDVSSTQDANFNLFHFISITLTNDEYKRQIIDCLGPPEYQRIKKPSILDMCNIVITNREMDKKDLMEHIKSNFGLSEKEVIDYFNKISAFSKLKKSPKQVIEAAELIK